MSYVEAYLKRLLWNTRGLTEKELGEFQVGEVMKRLLAWHDKQEPNQLSFNDLEDILREAGELKGLRNNMGHRQWHADFNGVVYKAEDWAKIATVTLSQEAIATAGSPVERETFTDTQLDELYLRAYVLTGRIIRFIMRNDWTEHGVNEFDKVWGQSIGSMLAMPRPPWLGEFSPRVRKQQKTTSTPRKSKRR
jgi:hypothetical protein